MRNKMLTYLFLLPLLIRNKRGQNILEYSVIIGIVVAALMVMQVYMKRGIQAATKVAADQLSFQNTAEIINLEKGGYLSGANAFTQTKSKRNVETGYLYSGIGIDRASRFNETTNTIGVSVYNLGNIE